MKYNLDNLNSNDFEGLVQSLCRKILGYGTITFGSGTDGGREASFQGKAEFPSPIDPWDGYWVVQAKFRQTSNDKLDNFSWIKRELEQELLKYDTRVIKVVVPDNYLLFTNCKLSAKPLTGGRDKTSALEDKLQKEYRIKNIRVISLDDIVDFLNNNRDVAVAYAPFILPGDLLSKLFHLLNTNDKQKERVKSALGLFIETEFREDIQSKLDHAGKLTSDRVNLEKVFIHLSTSESDLSDYTFKFINHGISAGNSILRPVTEGDQFEKPTSRFVLIAGPGYGKSTLTQFLAQIYRAFFLKTLDSRSNTAPEVDLFISDYRDIINAEPNCVRLPFKIVLKEYAGWIKDQTSLSLQANVSVVGYILNCIRCKSMGGPRIVEEDLEFLLLNIPSVFIFDGLDEVPVSSNREQVLKEINGFTEVYLRRLNSDSMIISTTRPQGYSKDFDSVKYKHIYIRDMDDSDCRLYLKRLLNNIIDDSSTRHEKQNILLKALQHREVSRIMKSPLQVSIMAILVKSGGEPPTNRFDLFTEYFNIIFSREKQRNILTILSDHPEYIKDIHNILGVFLQTESEKTTNPSASITIGIFRNLIYNYLFKKGLELEELNSTINEIIEASTDRLVFISQLQDDKVGFAIRSLQEFFAALGYFHNLDDQEVRIRLTRISKSAYWSNTMLFGIGYLAKNKEYLIDFVESICYKLNGSEDDVQLESLSSMSKMGSWRALDILKEGIFRSNRNLENKFILILKPLLGLPAFEKHKAFASLSEKMLSRSIFGMLENALIEDRSNYTIWLILSELHRQGYNVDNYVDEYFPAGSEKALKISILFIHEGTLTGALMKRFCNEIRAENKLALYQLFSKQENVDFLDSICKQLPDESANAVILEILFLLAASQAFDRSSNFLQICNSIGVILNDYNEKVSFFTNISQAMVLEITSQYLYSFRYSHVNSKKTLADLFEFATTINSHLIASCCSFFLNPSSKTYTSLRVYLDMEHGIYRERVIEIIGRTNSIFEYIFRNDIKPDSNDFHDTLREFAPSNLSLRDKSENRDSKLWMLRFGLPSELSLGEMTKVSEELVASYIDAQGPPEALHGFRTLIGWSMIMTVHGASLQLENKPHLIEVLKRALLIPWNTKFVIPLTDFLKLFEFFNREDLNAIINNLELMLSKSSIANSIFYREDRYKVVLEKHFRILIDLVRFQIFAKIPISLRMLMHTIMYTPDASWLKTLPYRELVESSDRSPFKALILILDPDFNQTSSDIVRSILTEHSSFLHSQTNQKYLFFALKHSANNSMTDEVIRFCKNELELTSESSNGEFLNFIVGYVGDFSSGVEVSELKINQ